MNSQEELKCCATCWYFCEEEDRRVCALNRKESTRGRAYPVPQSCCGDWKADKEE